MSNDQYRFHKAADIFRDRLLSDVEDESEMLRESSKLLESIRDIFTKVEIHLRDGHIISKALTRSFVNDSRRCVVIPIDADESDPRPLSDFSEGNLQMMGRTVGSLSGLVTQLLDILADGTILLRMSLSGHCEVEGVLRNLSVEDFASFADKSYSNRQITVYLMTGAGLRNAASLTFTPTLVLLEISPMLQAALKFIGQLPSVESIKNDLMCHFAEVGSVTCSQDLLNIFQDFPGLLSTVAAVGHTDVILGLLAENQLLKYDHRGLNRIQKMIGMIEISLPGFNAIVSLKDGTLCDHDGHSVWRNTISKKASPTSICRDSLTTMEVFLAGIPLPLTNTSLGLSRNGIDLDWFCATLFNGTKIHCRIYCSGVTVFLDSAGFVKITIDSPLSCVQSVLGMLGVDV